MPGIRDHSIPTDRDLTGSEPPAPGALVAAIRRLRPVVATIESLRASPSGTMTGPQAESLLAQLDHALAAIGGIVDALLTGEAAAADPAPAEEAVAQTAASGEAPDRSGPVVFVVDDDFRLRGALRAVLEDDGRRVEDFPSCEAFLDVWRPGGAGCLLIDAYLPGMSGLDLLRRLQDVDASLPSIMITGLSDVPMAIEAMKAGAADFIEKPVSRAALIASIDRALELSRDSGKALALQEIAAGQVARLTSRQRQIMTLVLVGHPSKNIAADLGISQRTVENHRAEIMHRTGAKSLPALARIALAADRPQPHGPGRPLMARP